VVMKK